MRISSINSVNTFKGQPIKPQVVTKKELKKESKDSVSFTGAESEGLRITKSIIGAAAAALTAVFLVTSVSKNDAKNTNIKETQNEPQIETNADLPAESKVKENENDTNDNSVEVSTVNNVFDDFKSDSDDGLKFGHIEQQQG